MAKRDNAHEATTEVPVEMMQHLHRSKHAGGGRPLTQAKINHRRKRAKLAKISRRKNRKSA